MADAIASSGTKPLYSNGYKATVLGLLLATYTFNFIDRTIIATIGQAIKVDLKLTDTQLGLLGGLYFALLYTILGIPIARLAERLKLSETPVWRRLRRLEEEGFITGYQALLNRKKLGIGLVAFVRVVFANHGGEQPSQFEQAIATIPEILSCHNVAGEADYFLQVVARDLEAYGEFVSTVLRRLPGVAEIQSSLSMREIKSSNRLPLLLA